MKMNRRNRPRSDAPLADMRGTLLYQEAERHFGAVFVPGSGRPVSATEPVAAPDGRQIAFTGAFLENLEGAAAGRICIADVDSGALRVVSFGPGQDMTPAFSPDGCTLAFRSDRGGSGNFQVYLLDLNTGLTRAAPVVEGWVESLEFSAGGRLLVQVAAHGVDMGAVQGGKTTKLAGADARPAWLPTVDSSYEAARGRSAWIIDIAANSSRRVSPTSLNIWECSWCGRNAIAAVVSQGFGEDAWYAAYLARIDLSSGRIKELYRPKHQLGWLSAAPGGKRVAVVEAVCSDRGLCAGDALIVDARNGSVQPVNTRGIDVACTVWRDDDRLLVMGIRGLETVVADVSAAGKVRERWSSLKLYSQSPHYPKVTPCGADGFAMFVHGHREPQSLVHVEKSTARTVLSLTNQGARELGRRLPAVEPYRWRAEDGTEIEGWLMRGSRNSAAPIVMEVHGGPIWRTSPMFLGRTAYYSMLAERGYGFFWPNPRGSTGRGQAFAGAVMGDMGGADARDLLSGLDKLVADGIADPRRLAVMGNSYGGYMSAWLITQDRRFAAAIPMAPITNWVSQHLTTNIPSFDPVYLDSKFNDAAGKHFSRSPVMFAHRVRTPALIVCGALDRCSPPGQAQEFHNALLLNGATSTLLTYPQEGHGIRGLPAAIDLSARVVDWLTRHMA